MGKEYNLHLSFALTEGNYVSDVEVQITDAKGRTVVERSPKALVFIKLPAGTYRIRAQMHGQPLEQVVQVSQQGQLSGCSSGGANFLFLRHRLP